MEVTTETGQGLNETSKPDAAQLTAFILGCVMCGVGMVMCAVSMVFLIRHRKFRAIKMTSPYLTMVLVVGVGTAYLSCLLSTLTCVIKVPTRAEALLRLLPLMLSVTFVHGAISTKGWRVYRIFHHPTARRKIIRDWHLTLFLLCLVTVDIVMTSLWYSVGYVSHGNLRNEEVKISNETSAHAHQIENPLHWRAGLFISAVVAFKGTIIFLSCYFSWRTQEVANSPLNESISGILGNLASLLIASGSYVTAQAVGSTTITSQIVMNFGIFGAATCSLLFTILPQMSLVRQYKGESMNFTFASNLLQSRDGSMRGLSTSIAQTPKSVNKIIQRATQQPKKRRNTKRQLFLKYNKIRRYFQSKSNPAQPREPTVAIEHRSPARQIKDASASTEQNKILSDDHAYAANMRSSRQNSQKSVEHVKEENILYLEDSSYYTAATETHAHSSENLDFTNLQRIYNINRDHSDEYTSYSSTVDNGSCGTSLYGTPVQKHVTDFPVYTYDQGQYEEPLTGEESEMFEIASTIASSFDLKQEYVVQDLMSYKYRRSRCPACLSSRRSRHTRHRRSRSRENRRRHASALANDRLYPPFVAVRSSSKSRHNRRHSRHKGQRHPKSEVKDVTSLSGSDSTFLGIV